MKKTIIQPNNLRAQFDDKGLDVERMTFSASTFLALFFGLSLLSKLLLWVLFGVTTIFSIYQGYNLFIKKKVRYDGLKEFKRG